MVKSGPPLPYSEKVAARGAALVAVGNGIPCIERGCSSPCKCNSVGTTSIRLAMLWSRTPAATCPGQETISGTRVRLS